MISPSSFIRKFNLALFCIAITKCWKSSREMYTCMKIELMLSLSFPRIVKVYQNGSTKVNQYCYTIRIMHEYLTGYDRYFYGQCIDCNKRTQHFCTICQYCYSCHYKIEKQNKETYPHIFLAVQQIDLDFVKTPCIQ